MRAALFHLAHLASIVVPAAFLLSASAAQAATSAEKTHVVGRGDTLVRIARRYHVGVEALREANGLGPKELLHPGLSLVIPGRGEAVRGARAVATTEAAGAVRAGRGGRDPHHAKEKAAPPEPRAVEPKAGRANVEYRGPRRRGLVRLVRNGETLEVQLATRHGRLAPNALASFSHMLRSNTGAKLAMDPRLAALVAQVSDHFGGRPLRVVSGFRPYSPVQYTPHSNHNLGRAMDFAIEGVPNTVLRDFCRGFRDAGVGYYPNSTFVHLDVRTGKAFWIDYARPGEAPKYDPAHTRPKGESEAEEAEAHAGVGDGESAEGSQ